MQLTKFLPKELKRNCEIRANIFFVSEALYVVATDVFSVWFNPLW